MRTRQAAVPTPAATVVPLRDGEDGLEVLLLRRSARGAFGGMWVFPGGQVDPGDLGASGDAGRPRRSRWPRPGEAAVREAREEAGLVLVEAELVTLSFWLPPPEAPRRFATWFFLAPADDHPPVVVDDDEIHEHRWQTPAAAMAARNRGEIELVPPTFTTLWWLAQHPNVAAALAAGGARPPERFMTRMAAGADGRPPGGALGRGRRLRRRGRRPARAPPAPVAGPGRAGGSRSPSNVRRRWSPARALRFDPIAEARRQWRAHGWEDAADGMAAVTSVFRAQQIYLARIDAILRPLGPDLRPLRGADAAAVQPGRLPSRSARWAPGCRSTRPASPTPSTASRSRACSARVPHPSDGRTTLATITPLGRRLAEKATDAGQPRRVHPARAWSPTR